MYSTSKRYWIHTKVCDTAVFFLLKFAVHFSHFMAHYRAKLFAKCTLWRIFLDKVLNGLIKYIGIKNFPSSSTALSRYIDTVSFEWEHFANICTFKVIHEEMDEVFSFVDL
jgi:hypothetical protein